MSAICRQKASSEPKDKNYHSTDSMQIGRIKTVSFDGFDFFWHASMADDRSVEYPSACVVGLFTDAWLVEFQCAALRKDFVGAGRRHQHAGSTICFQRQHTHSLLSLVELEL
jgi:hypothetical protein